MWYARLPKQLFSDCWRFKLRQNGLTVFYKLHKIVQEVWSISYLEKNERTPLIQPFSTASSLFWKKKYKLKLSRWSREHWIGRSDEKNVKLVCSPIFHILSSIQWEFNIAWEDSVPVDTAPPAHCTPPPRTPSVVGCTRRAGRASRPATQPRRNSGPCRKQYHYKTFFHSSDHELQSSQS